VKGLISYASIMDSGRPLRYGRAVNERQPTRADLYRIVERLVAENQALKAEVDRLTRREAELEAELERVRARPSPPAWVKKNAPARTGPKQPRKKRARNFARRRDAPTRREVHAETHCPACGETLRGGTVKRHREVIEIELPPVVVTDHVLVERTCPRCGTAVTPVLGAADGVVGQHRFGPRLLALITTWHEAGLMPVRTIQTQLQTLFGVHVSLGGIEDALHTMAERGAGRVAAIRDEIRQSAVVHADETGWREDGQNRYVWLIATPTARYFELGRRTNEQIDQILGPAFGGILVTDFYSAYNHFLGEKQSFSRRTGPTFCATSPTSSRSTPTTKNSPPGANRFASSIGRPGMPRLKRPHSDGWRAGASRRRWPGTAPLGCARTSPGGRSASASSTTSTNSSPLSRTRRCRRRTTRPSVPCGRW